MRNRCKDTTTTTKTISATKLAPETTTIPSSSQKVDIADIDKRAFLKLIGGTGLSFLLYALFNKKPANSLLSPLSDQGTTALLDVKGNVIDPREKLPTDGYTISEIEDDLIAFYGFTNRDGAWFVMKEDTESGSVRYVKGDTDFSAFWTKRENLNYDYFNKVF